MPAVPTFRYRPTRLSAAGVLALLLLTSGFVVAQPPIKPTAFKLPDGTVIILTKNPDDLSAPADGVLLSAKAYQTLLDQAEQLKKVKDAPKPQSPSECHIRGRIDTAGGQPLAVLTLTYSYQTTAPRTTVSLGGQRGLPKSAKPIDGKLPILGLADDGLTVLAERPGTVTLTVEYEVPVTARGSNGELGFDIGLPKSAITTFTLEPGVPGKNATVGSRTPDRPTEVRRTAYRAGAALGPTDLLDVTWEPATTNPAADPGLTAESEITVRVDETQIETSAKIRLRGPGRDWQLMLPSGSDVSVDRATLASGAPDPGLPPVAATLVRPTDAAKPIWTVRVPSGSSGEWIVTANSRQNRPKPTEPKFRGPYPIGPIAVPAALRHSGTIRVYAPASVRVSFKPSPDVRRQDLPSATELDLVALFKFLSVPRSDKKLPQPLLELDARTVPGFVRIEPTYKLQLTRAGWRLTADLKVTPVRAELDQLLVELPDGWPGGLEASAPRRIAGDGGPAELVDEVEVLKESGPKTLAVRLAVPQKMQFDLTLATTLPIAPGVREATIGLLRFPQAIEQNARLTVSVPDGVEVRGTATGRDAGQPGELVDLTSQVPASGAGITNLVASFEKGVGRADLSWQPYRPELIAGVRGEVALQDRQAVVTQTMKLQVADGGAWRAVRFRGPTATTGLRVTSGPSLEAIGPGEWEMPPPPAGTKEVTLVLNFGLLVPTRKSDQIATVKFDLGLIWPEAATRVESGLRIWGGSGGRRIASFEGRWRELPPEPDPTRDSLPWLTLTGTGGNLPLTLLLTDPTEGPLPSVWVERVLIQTWVGEDVAAIRGRFLLRRWSASGVDLLLPPGVAAEVYVDGKKAENLTAPSIAGYEGTVARVPLPEIRPNRMYATIDVRYQLPTRRTPTGEVRLSPPLIVGAAYRSPARWQAFFVPGVVTLCFAPDLQLESRWTWRNGMFSPVAASTATELDQWFAAGTDPDSEPTSGGVPVPSADPDALTARQPVPAVVKVYRVPRTLWVGASSMLALLLVLGVSRLRPELLGATVALLGGGIAVLSVIWPQPMAQFASGAQPGLVLAAIVLFSQMVLRWYHRRRINHLPGFTRSYPDTGSGLPSGLPTLPSNGTGSNLVPLNEPVGTTAAPGNR